MFANGFEHEEDPYNYENRNSYPRNPGRPAGFLKFVWGLRPLRYITLGAILAVAGFITLSGLRWGNPRQNPIQPATGHTAPVPAWRLDRELSGALSSARAAARDRARVLVGRLTADMRERLEREFLPRHLSYARQQELALKSGWFALRRFIDHSAALPREQLIKTISTDFRRSVIRPAILSQELQRIASDTVACYIAAAGDEIEKIPSRMPVPSANWRAYSAQLAELTADIDAGRTYPVVIKAAGAGGALAASRLVLPKIAAGRLSAAIAAKLTTKVCGPLIAGLTLVWDIWDHRVTTAEVRPVLKRNLGDYLTEVERLLVDEIMAVVGDVESQIITAAPGSGVSKKKEE